MISNDKNIKLLMELIETSKDFVVLQKEELKISAIEKLIRLVYTFTMIIIIFSLCIAILFYISMAAVEYLTPTIGRTWAFITIALAYIFVAACVCCFRKRLIEKPVTRFITKTFIN